MTVWVNTGVTVTSAREGSTKKADADTGTGINNKRPAQGRADDEMGRWRKTLSPNQRAKLEGQASPWGRNGGSIVVPKRRRTKTARKHEKLLREREARLRAEQVAYKARRAGPWTIETNERQSVLLGG